MGRTWARVLRAFLFAAAVPAATGCGYHLGFLQEAATGNQIQFHMAVATERYARTVSGSASIGSIFCVIPLDEGIYKQAMQALLEDAHLRPNESLQNVRVDSDPICFLVYGVSRLTISGDVYEMTPVGGTPAPAGSVAASVPTQDAASTPAQTPTPKPKPTRLTYAQLQEAFTQLQADKDRTNQHAIAIRILGRPQKTDAENELWYGGLPGKEDCYVLRLSYRGASLDDAPSEKCWSSALEH